MHRYIFRVDFKTDKHRSQFIHHWKEGSAVIQTLPGARGTKLHAIPDSTSVIAIAEWDSKQLRDEAMAIIHNPKTRQGKKWLAMPKNEDFGEVTILGEVDEIDFVPSSHP